MDAILTAGETPNPGDSLYEYTQGAPKALLDIGGKPMIQWMLDALDNARHVSGVVVAGLHDKYKLNCRKLLEVLPDAGGMVENVVAGTRALLKAKPATHSLMLASSDTPAITAEMVDWVAENALGFNLDVHYHIVRREVMEGRYPASRHRYFRLKDIEFTGADLNVIAAWTVDAHTTLGRHLRKGRKSTLGQLPVVGFKNVVKYIFRRFTLKSAIEEAQRVAGMTGTVHICPYPELGMDADTAHHYKLLRAELAPQSA